MSDHKEEEEFKTFIKNMKDAIDEDLAHPENFEDDQEQLEAFREISKNLGNIDKLNRTELFQLGMEVGGMIHMMELSNEIFDALEEGEEEEQEWDDENDDHQHDDHSKKSQGHGGCGSCGCH